MQNISTSKLLYTAGTVWNRGVNNYDSHRVLEVNIHFAADEFASILWNRGLMTYSQKPTTCPIIYQVNPVQNFTLFAFQNQFFYYTIIYVYVFQDGIWRRSPFPEDSNLQQQLCVTLKLRIPNGPLHGGSETNKKKSLFLFHFVYLVSHPVA